MGYRITIDDRNCINCGICMDVCPVQALDMTRPTRAGVEFSGGFGAPLRWMMEYPVQTGECIGCSMCVNECPVSVVHLDTVAGVTPVAPHQGPITMAAAPGEGWVALSDVTREGLKPHHPSPFGPWYRWHTRADVAQRPAWLVDRDVAPAPIAPCQSACPAGTDAARYVGLLAEGRNDEAYAVAAEVNPFPAVCGWICTAPCESACRRGVLDEPIAIRTLKRFAVEHGRLPAIEKPVVLREGRVAIVGGGPAGMSAAYYLARLGYRVTVFEAMPVPGGMMAIGIPEYRLPRAALRAEIQRILDLGVELRLGSVMGRDFTLADLEAQGFQAIFLATGASRSRRLGVPGDDLPGVIPATVFLKETNIGEPPVLSGSVVVVGGGSTAMDAARSALRAGAASVTVVYRRRREDMPAQHEEVEAAEREGVSFIFEHAPDHVAGDAAVTGLVVRRQAPAGTAPDGALTDGPVDAPGEIVPAATILVAIGEEPDPSILPAGAGIEVTQTAAIATDPGTLATGRAGVFAGGDVVSGPKTIIDAVAAGRRAAGSIHGYLAGVADGEAAVMAAVRYRTATPEVLPLDLAVRPRARAPLPMFEPGSFAATQQGFEPDMARTEAARCFRCDAVHRCGDVRVTAGRQVMATPEVATAGGRS